MLASLHMSIGPFEYNKIQYDEFGRASGVIGVYKPRGITSHDVVYKIRRQYFTKLVGHAGTLDPFAEGLLIILIGKALKYADQLIGLDKTYEAKSMIGVETNSGDIEGDVINSNFDSQFQSEKYLSVRAFFTPGYLQQVPIFSSVKVQGQKLRVLARSADTFAIRVENNKKWVDFITNAKITKTLEIPQRKVALDQLDLTGQSSLKAEIILEDSLISDSLKSVIEYTEKKSLATASFIVSCSKGTYIRQLIIDIGHSIKVPMTLYALKRTRIGEFTLEGVHEIQ